MKYSQEVYSSVPSGLRPMFKKAFTLKFDEEPPYDAYIETLQQELKILMQSSSVSFHQFEWTKNHAKGLISQEIKQNEIQEQEEEKMSLGEFKQCKSKFLDMNSLEIESN